MSPTACTSSRPRPASSRPSRRSVEPRLAEYRPAEYRPSEPRDAARSRARARARSKPGELARRHLHLPDRRAQLAQQLEEGGGREGLGAEHSEALPVAAVEQLECDERIDRGLP